MWVKFLVVFSLLVIAGGFASSGANAATSNDSIPEAANFFTPNLEVAYSSLLTSVHFGASCEKRFGFKCFAENNIANIDYLMKLFETIKIYSAYKSYDDIQFEDLAAFDSQWKSLNDRFMENSFDYEIDFFARYSASSRTCPREIGSDRDKEIAISAFERIDFVGFWRLSPQTIHQSVDEISRRREQYLTLLSTTKNCVAIRIFGARLAEILKLKLKPYINAENSSINPEATPKEGKFGGEVGFISAVTELIQSESKKTEKR